MKKISIIVLVIAIVALAGVVVWQGVSQSKPSSSLPAANQPAVNQEQQPQTETAGWKTYTNNKVGYTVKYPLNWYYKDYADDVTIDDMLLSYVAFSSKSLTNERSQGDTTIMVENRPFAEARAAFLQNPLISVSEKTITIDDTQATNLSGRMKGAKYSTIEVMVSKNDKIYTIIGTDNPSTSIIFDQMLSTFKFIK